MVKLLSTLIITILTSITALPANTTDDYDPDDYPTWDEVLEARDNEEKTEEKIAEIEALIADLETTYYTALTEAEQAGAIYEEKLYEYDTAVYEYESLYSEYVTAAEEAETAKLQSGIVLAEMSKTGTLDLQPMKIFLNPEDTPNVLSKIGYAEKISTNLNSIFNDAVLKQNTAESLAEKAETAKTIREQAAVEAEEAYNTAYEAQIRAETALQTQQQKTHELQTQLEALTSEREMTEEGYREGITAKKAAEEAARKAAQQSGQSNTSTFTPNVSSSNWAKPTSGYISSHYGWRIHPIYGTQRFHSGTDFANSCGTPMYAASAGTVEYAGWLGTLGYFIRINHGNGLTTGYGHIREGGIKVSIGQQVQAGEYIADMGTTGGSTGCHLHFEVRSNRVAGDPVTFLREQGVGI